MIILFFLFFFANICASSDFINALNLDRVGVRKNKYSPIPNRQDFSSNIDYQDALEKSLKEFNDNINIVNQRIKENEPNIVNEKQKREEQKIQKKRERELKRKDKKIKQYKQKLIDYIHQKQEELFPLGENIDEIQVSIENLDKQNLIGEINKGFALIREKGIKIIQKLNLDNNVNYIIFENDEIPEIITEQHKRKYDNELYELIRVTICGRVFHDLSPSFKKLILFNINGYNQLITEQIEKFFFIEDCKRELCVKVSWSRSLANFILLLPSAVKFYGDTGFLNIDNHNNNRYSELKNALCNGRDFYGKRDDSKIAFELYYELYLTSEINLTDEEKIEKGQQLKNLLGNLKRNPYFKYLKKKLYPNIVEKSFKYSFGGASGNAYVAHHLLLESKKNDNSPQENEVQENKKNSENEEKTNEYHAKISTQKLDFNVQGIEPEPKLEPKLEPESKSRKILNNIKQYITLKNIVILVALGIFFKQSLSYLKKR